MERTAVNPWDWSLNFGYNQAELVTGMQNQLIVSGQTSVDENGAPQHGDDMRGQVELAMSNLEAVLQKAEMGMVDVVKLTIYATDVDALMQNFDVIGAKLGQAGVTPPMSVIGVTRLAIPELMFEIEAIAAS